ncbi:MAG: DUF2341 domain-containing protein [Proteobacteria bacterium]|nr:DUF2341 domain-containing protein [Pseudomonadota bacterium]
MRSALLLLMVVGSSAHAAPQSDWWNPDWQHRQKLTIDSNGRGLSGTVTDFPVMVRLAYVSSDVQYQRADFDLMNDDGSDLRFVDSNGTLLPHEIERFNTSLDRASIHVKIPSIAPNSTVDIWMYYGNSNASTPTNGSSVWDSSFEAVWHVGETSTLTDSTGRGRSKNASGNTYVQGWTRGFYGVLDGNGDYWGGTGDGAWDANTVLGESEEATVSYWFATDQSGRSNYWDCPGILGIERSGSNDVFYGYVTSSGKWAFRVSGPGTDVIESTSAVNNWYWHHAFMTRDKSEGRLRMYIDGVLQGDVTGAATTNKTTSVWYVGRIPGGDREYFDGLIDDVRISSTERNGDWAKLEFASWIDNSAGTHLITYCDGETYYADADGDGYGDENDSGLLCVESYGDVTNATDCNDGDALASPAEQEICDGIDNDCDDDIDDADSDVLSDFYADNDEDGLGFGSAQALGTCTDPGPKWSPVDGDCDDTNANILGPSTWWPDTDNDGTGVLAGAVEACTQPPGFVAPTAIADCAPTDTTVHPNATELCDALDVDEDCNGAADDVDPGAIGQTPWWFDNDGDTYGAGSSTPACDAPGADFVPRDGDCDDNDPLKFPGASWYADNDGDGAGAGLATASCEAPGRGWSLNNDDCNDSDPDLNPETPWYLDADGDGWGDFGTEERSCLIPTLPGTWVRNSQDCDDTVQNIDPGGDPWYPDVDLDEFGDPNGMRRACVQPPGFVADNTDCNDADEEIYPGQVDLPCNGVDDNCNPIDDGPLGDLDGDGVNWIDEFNLGTDGCSDDSDGDGIGDVIEFTRGDSDNDTIPDVLDADDDGDGIATANEVYTGAGPDDEDSDRDQIPDYLDPDDDGDGIPTADEDRDGDALFDDDTDNDNTPDYLDPDDDGDGVPTLWEYPVGTQYTTDADFDSIPDVVEWGLNLNGPPRDTDLDLIPDPLDEDDDGDGIPTFTEGDWFVECQGPDDGRPPYVDVDTDGDGLLDRDEGLTDSDNDFQPDYADCDTLDGPDADRDGDGILNRHERPCAAEWNPISGDRVELGAGLACPGFECLGEGTPDSDFDGIHDGAEFGQLGALRDSDNDGIMDVCDTDDDNDTALTIDEISVADAQNRCVGVGCPPLPPLPAPPMLPDQDGDTRPNHHDTDDDGDGIHTADEDYNGDGDPHTDDTDWDGLVDYLDPLHHDGPCGDPDGDGLPTAVEEALGSDPQLRDSDFDRVPDGVEYGHELDWDAYTATVHCDQAELFEPVNTDGDALVDFYDADDDNDGIPTIVEGSFDIDGDGEPNHLDLDADGDGVDDASELDTDVDCDGLPDFIDPDNDDNYCGSDLVDTADTADTGLDPEDCGCRSVQGTAGLGLVLLPLFVRRRRYGA